MFSSQTVQTGPRAVRGPYLTFYDDPFRVGDDHAFQYESDGAIFIDGGRIVRCGPWQTLRREVGDIPVDHYPDDLILSGFIDTHVHYPQTQIIGSYGRRLIDWLNDYTFIEEQRFAYPGHAAHVARVFLQECLRAGTTTASVYCTVHPESAQAFFEEAGRLGLCMVAGKVLMDRNAPDALCDTPESAYDQSKELIDQWHGKGRLHYAITPRFAPTSSPAQLEAAAALWREHRGTFLQTHLSENTEELAWVKSLFPDRCDYTDVYDHFGLLGERALFGHAIHLSPREWNRLGESGSSVVHCPTSNAFLGSGAFNFQRACEGNPAVRAGLATDVGGGTSLSMLQTMKGAYEIGQAGRYSLSAIKAFYLATRGNARALHLEHRIGSIQEGGDADLVVLNLRSTPLIDFRMQRCESLAEALFVQMIMADDRATRATYVAGYPVYRSQTA